MSSLSQAEAVALAWEVQNFSACTSASVTLVYFDYFVTLPQEIALIWFTKWTPGKAIFVTVRYLGLWVATMYAYALRSTTSTVTGSCAFTLYSSLSSLLLLYIAAALVLALRTWAVWNRGPRVGIFIALAWTAVTVGIIVFGVQIILGTSPDGALPILPGCNVKITAASAAASVRGYASESVYEGGARLWLGIRAASDGPGSYLPADCCARDVSL
ncbi:hypothetical protein CALCODRAFT_104429 [Calocera cornea HHB12733]|uniref:DUF6533 domain-containing protein n=1 Tax=Calocera cornea HHB12733 TaxID=1353952 RepID=A0A165D4K4_9BASI|nr:hypothetical protein CALCODRAFT_104429 [Calocera cornea HHB12733]